LFLNHNLVSTGAADCQEKLVFEMPIMSQIEQWILLAYSWRPLNRDCVGRT